jgi:very-short-patch-repair endonuclease
MRDPGPRDIARRLRRDATRAERVLWRHLRGDALGVTFRRQHPVPPYVADFACLEARLIVEVDGGQHGGARDAIRDSALQAAGWRVLRYWNNDVLTHGEGVVEEIARVARERVRG